MDAQLAALGMEVERLPATTPETIPWDDIVPLSREEVCESLALPEIATSMSHFRAWKRMLDQGHSRVLVLEDDVLLSKRLPAFLDAIEGNKIGVLRLESRMSEVYLDRRSELGPEGIRFHVPRNFEAGAAGYVISADYARRILQSRKRFSIPIDDILFSLKSPFRDTAAIRTGVPALVLCRYEKSAQFDVPERILASDVHESRVQHSEALIKPKGLAKLHRELSRIRQQIALLPAMIAQKFAQRTMVPFADGEISGPR